VRTSPDSSWRPEICYISFISPDRASTEYSTCTKMSQSNWTSSYSYSWNCIHLLTCQLLQERSLVKFKILISISSFFIQWHVDCRFTWIKSLCFFYHDSHYQEWILKWFHIKWGFHVISGDLAYIIKVLAWTTHQYM
jgi:hypothetical protein